MSNPLSRSYSPVTLTAGLLAATVLLAGCGAAAPATASNGLVTVENCGAELTFPSPATKIFANDSQVVLNLLALEADDQITAVAGISDTRLDQLRDMYGAERIDKLPMKSDVSFNLEMIQAQQPDVVMAGYGWGYSVEKNITPDRLLSDFAIPAYTITPTCLPGTIGSMTSWDEAFADLTNIGQIIGHEDRAQSQIDELNQRRAALEAAPQAEVKPSVLYITSVSKDGVASAGQPHMFQTMIETAGARNSFEALDQKSPKVSWESITAADPDFIVLTDTGSGTGAFEEKVAALQENPATRSLDAVQQGRILRLPTDMGRSGVLMMDTSENLRQALESAGLLPASGLTPRMTLNSSK